MSFSFNGLPRFTISRIEVINRLVPRLHRINNPESSMLPSYVPRERVRSPSGLSTLFGHIIALTIRFGVKLPDKLMGCLAVRCCGSFENPGSFFQEGWIVYCYVGHNSFVKARFLEVNHQDGSAAILVSDLSSKDLFEIGSTIPLLDGYWGERAQLVYDASREWHRVRFTPSDSIRYRSDGLAEEVEGGWDHEHCAICWQTIGQYVSGNEYGYRDQDDRWVCQTCYDQYIVPKCLDFVILDQMF